jgi:hypothetical protein
MFITVYIPTLLGLEEYTELFSPTLSYMMALYRITSSQPQALNLNCFSSLGQISRPRDLFDIMHI